MRARRSIAPSIALLGAALVALAACNRKIEPFDPNETPRQPDLSKIFPAGAERADRIEPGLPEPPGGDGRGAAPAAAESGEPIHGTVSIAPELAARVPDGAVLFLIARRGDGGPPLAVKRIAQPSFPLDFELGPQDRMIQALPFAGPMTLSARIDADGNAMSRTPGDLHGELATPVEPGATGIDLRIDQVVTTAQEGRAGAPVAAAEEGESGPIHGTVRIAPELAARVPGGAVLFLIARHGGTPMPVAVKRIESPRFPLDFELGPQDRPMMMAPPFEGPLTLSARIDSDGNATSRTPGDLYGELASPVEPGATGVDMLIDQVVTSPQG